MDLNNYEIALRSHDWYFYFSDDHRVYSAGEQAGSRLRSIAENGNDAHKKVYNKYHAKHFNTPGFVTDNRPYKPPFNV